MSLVSENIRYLRKLNGLTQEQFSRKINIKRSLLGAYEEGRANPNQENMQAIARAFNTTIELLTRQDLRKLRETPNLSIPLGQANKAAEAPPIRPAGTIIRSDGKLTTNDDDDPFQHPDFPDIFAPPESARPGLAPSTIAQPSPKVPEPQPLAAVLNKYYQAPEQPRRTTDRPVPPVITSPVRPGQDRPGLDRTGQDAPAERTQPMRSGDPGFQPVQFNSPADRLFGQQPESRASESRASESRTPESRPATTAPQTRQSEPLVFNNVYEGPGNIARSTGSASLVAPAISVVMQPQFGEYAQRYQQAEFVHHLPAMYLPTLPEGHYRAFEAGDDFAFPGALLVGQFVRNWFDIADGKLYVLLIQHQGAEGSGVFCRRIYNQVKIKGTLLLTADKANISNREIALKDVAEVWEVRAFVSQHVPNPPPSTDRLRQLVDEIRFEVERL